MKRSNLCFVLGGLALATAPMFGCSANNNSSMFSASGGNGTGNGGAGGSGGGGIFVNNGGSGASVTMTTGVAGADCQATPKPKACTMAAPPGCGDGMINQASEACDDGNTLAGDGCNGLCVIEPNHACPTEGKPCVVSFTCGDGVVNPGEACDQGQFQGNPGCTADCKTQETGYKCIPAEQCTPLYKCGNKLIETGETCDDGNTTAGDGCSAACKTEAGYTCKPGSCAKAPYCGDGIVQTSSGEKCDQGQYKSSPGCSADCLSMDGTCTCTPGQACVCQKPTCGDGIVQVGEQCDDKNSSYPGCNATCQLESGYKCPFAGAPCVPVCGDGILISPAEQCDPAAKIPNVATACSADCSVKPGWVCDATSCRQTSCGDGKIEGSEGCDSGSKNNDLGDGCTGTCMAEPTCPAGGGACSTKCGDSLVLGSEKCDDGNAVSGDGCSATCDFEAGFTCTQPPLGDTMVVPMVVRDFNGGGDFEKAAAFATGLNYANQGLLKGSLDAQGLKPELNGTTGTYNGTAGQDSGIASAASFAQWYKDAASGPNAYHGTLATTLNLYLNKAGNAYVNRFGVNGDGLTSAQYLRTHTNQCGTANQSNHDADGNPILCTACYYNATDPLNLTPCTQIDTTPCQTDATYTGECVVNGNAYIGTFLDAAFDGNPLFFPADSLTPANPAVAAQISGNYNPSWPVDPSGKLRNFSFTTEVRFWFSYDSSKTYKLTFVGDDDVWVFINKKLAVDLGGIHTAVQGELTIAGGTATTVVTPTNVTPAPAGITSKPVLGLTNGNVYEIAVFQAERQTKASSYQLSLSGFNAAHSVCKPVCGGDNPGVSPGEECDNGSAGNCDVAAADCYNKCTTTCTLGPRCGDGEVQGDHEQCDNGKNTDGYAAAGSNACSPTCTLPPNCGDGKVQLNYNEECDNGAENNDTLYGGCATSCKLGPYCGDAVVNGDDAHPEVCDNGVNDGTYGTCGVGCTLPPRCGDAIVQSDWGEQCEPTASDDPNCTKDCRLPGYCGDGVVDNGGGEICDYGTAKNDGSYGGCNSNCTPAAYCGDGVTNGPEVCDLGAALNIGEYGGCASTCQLGPHCGDGLVNGKEECDDGSGAEGNGTALSDCTGACKNYQPI